MKIKGWHEFQHFKDRSPIWVKLYRRLLDDHEWHKLDGEAAKLLVMLWLLASEADGEVTDDLGKIAFRFRVTESHINKHLPKLSHYLIQDDDKMISGGYQDDALEKRRDREETEKTSVRFSEEAFGLFWSIHPYGSKKDARDAYKKTRTNGAPQDSELLEILSKQIQERERLSAAGDFAPRLPHLCRWFSHHRWEDAPLSAANMGENSRPDIDQGTMEKFLKGELD